MKNLLLSTIAMLLLLTDLHSQTVDSMSVYEYKNQTDSLKTTYAYNNSGNLIYQISYSWDKGQHQWNPISGIRWNETLGLNNRIEKIEDLTQNGWITKNTKEQFFDNKKRFTSIIVSSFNTSNQELIEKTKDSIQYIKDNLVKDSIKYIWSISLQKFEPSKRFTKNYDSLYRVIMNA